MGKRGWPPFALWLAALAWIFSGPLLAGRVLYFRDVSVTYYPDYVFVARALREGTWPLWHPGVDGGTPFLMAYPVHLVLLLVGGARATLALSPALHILLAMVGTAVLARRLGTPSAGAALAGAVFGLSGWMLGSVLYPVFLAAAWAPLVAALFLALVEAPTARRVALLALVLAAQVTTQGVEAILQTALLALALLPWPPSRRALLAAGGAVALAALLASPALVGAASLLQGTARGHGFAPQIGFSYSASLPVLLEGVLPRFLGNPHTFSEVGFWGQPFFPEGSPFVLSLYVGPLVLLLAACAGWREVRLWGLVVFSVALGLGAHGPLALPLAPVLRWVRAPVKFLLLATLALSLLAGKGLELGRERRAARTWPLLIPGLLFLALGLVAWHAPAAVSVWLAWLVPPAAQPLAIDVIRTQWPLELVTTAALALGAGFALAGGRRWAAAAGLLVVLDLLRVNGDLSASTDAAFYELRPPLRRMAETARAEGLYRWFSYGVASSPPLHWDPTVARRNSDVWLYYLDRQALVPRTHVLDGLQGAFDVDRMGLAPEGATLTVAETRPAAYRACHARLRLANVRWVVAFHDLPHDLVSLREQVPLPEVQEPLRLYELRDPLPRAFWVPRSIVESDPVRRRALLEDPAFDPRSAVVLSETPLSVVPAVGRAGPARVDYEQLDAHTVRISASTPPGFLVVLDGFHPDWKAEDASAPVPLWQADGRYRALPTPGGEHAITLRYQPRWRGAALALASLSALACLALAARSVRPPFDFSGRRARGVLISSFRRARDR